MIGMQGAVEISVSSCTFTGNWVYECEEYDDVEQATLIHIYQSPAQITIQSNIFEQHKGFIANVPSTYQIDFSSLSGKLIK